MMNAAINNNNNVKYYTAEKLITNAQFMKNVATRSLNLA